MSEAPSPRATDAATVSGTADHASGEASTSAEAARRARFAEVRATLAAQLIGHERLIERLLAALLTGGHVLLEGPPGVAKTRAIRRFAALLDARFVRVQATPDLMPADITGTDVYDQREGTFRFVAGPLFNHVVLVDEINRAPPKVQSALLEAMGERQITTGGVTRALEEPFLVAATQNPIEHEGTYPLPEAQLDRFMFFVALELPDAERERRILDHVLDERAATTDAEAASDRGGEPIAPSAARAEAPDATLVALARADVARTFLSEAVRDYVVRLVCATRGLGAGGGAAAEVAQAASPRGSIHLAAGAQARAWLDGRDFVTPDDVAALAPDVLSGRIALDYRARADGLTAREIVERIVAATPRV